MTINVYCWPLLGVALILSALAFHALHRRDTPLAVPLAFICLLGAG